MSEKKEEVNHPDRYKESSSLECIEVMKVIFGREAVYQFCLCNSFKYLWRYKFKNGIEDMNKARWYLDYVEQNLGLEAEESFTDIRNLHKRIMDLFITTWDEIANNGGV